MAALPYMPLFVADYLADTAHLTPAQHGAYLLLIFNYWQRGGPLPNDDMRLARIARMNKRDWAHNRDDILEFFYVQDNLLRHIRIDAELARVEAKSLKCSEAGRTSAERRSNRRQTNAEPTEAQAHTDKSEPKGSSVSPVVFDEKKAAIGSCLRAAWPCPPGVDPNHWRDFRRNRKTKRLTDSETAYQGQLRELEKLSDDEWPPGRLVQHAAEKGWGTINDPRTPRFGNERSDRDPTTVALERLIGNVGPHAGVG